MVDFLPEWQIQESLAADPKRLEIPGRFEGIRVRREQRYLPAIGRYIDLLCTTKKPGGWLIVEVKAQAVTSRDPIDQALDYRSAFAKELRLSKTDVGCMVAAPGHPSVDVQALSDSEGVALLDLNLDSLVDSAKRPGSYRSLLGAGARRTLVAERRARSLGALQGAHSPSRAAIDTWLNQGTHDQHGLEELGQVLRHLSDNAPIFAHEVGGRATRLDSPEAQWFWLFYSALDRRGSAALFVRARFRLESEGLFDPATLCEFVNRNGEAAARARITALIEDAEVPLVVDLQLGRESLSQSIIDAAKFVVDRGGFEQILATWRRECTATGEDIGRHAVRAVQAAVYGMGPRSAAQFVRGMVLKGPWQLDMTNPVFLENTKYHGLFAGKARISIAVEDYPREGGAFAATYLGGDRGVLSHALWYIRKRYCDKIPLCGECPVAGYCAYFRRVGSGQVQRSRPSPSQGKTFKQLTLTAQGPTAPR
jgi:hypothetical protein